MELFGTLKAKVGGLVGTEIEKKVKEATGPENWNVSNTLKNEIATASFKYVHFKEIMPIIWDRLDEDPVMWRMIVKSLALIEHLLRLGSDWVVEDVRDHIHKIRSLTRFRYSDDDGNEYGSGVRDMSKKIIELLGSPEILREAREKSATTGSSKYVGMNSSGSVSSTPGVVGKSTYGGYGSSSYNNSTAVSTSSGRTTRSAQSSSISSYPAPRQRQVTSSHETTHASAGSYGSYPLPQSSETRQHHAVSSSENFRVKAKPSGSAPLSIKLSEKPLTEQPGGFAALDPPPGDASSNTMTQQSDPFAVIAGAGESQDDDFDAIVDFQSASSAPQASVTTNDDIFGEFASLGITTSASSTTPQVTTSSIDPFDALAGLGSSVPGPVQSSSTSSVDLFSSLASSAQTAPSTQTSDPFAALMGTSSHSQQPMYDQQQVFGQFQQGYEHQQAHSHHQQMHGQPRTLAPSPFDFNTFSSTSAGYSAPAPHTTATKKTDDPFSDLSWS